MLPRIPVIYEAYEIYVIRFFFIQSTEEGQKVQHEFKTQLQKYFLKRF